MHACHNDKLQFVQLLLGVGGQNKSVQGVDSSQPVSQGVDLDAVSKHGLTAIMLACDAGSDHVVKVLLDAGVKLSQKNSMGMTALLLAVSLAPLVVRLVKNPNYLYVCDEGGERQGGSSEGAGNRRRRCDRC